jgi:lipopolysaccharide transport system ATP-binding protein
MRPSIRIDGVGKRYRLGLTHDRSLRDLTNRLARSVTGRRPPEARTPVSEQAGRVDDAGWFWALKDIDLTVERGEVVGIIGKNGAGKSTLLKILSRITAPTVGRVELSGRVASLLEVGTGFHPELTGRENVFLNGTVLGLSRAEVRERFDDIVEFAGLPAFIDTPVKRYSSGMTVRLGFAVAAHLEPDILIVDEVLAVGDAEFRKRCVGKMREVSESGRAVLFVSHNMASIRALTTRSAVISHGALTFVGSTSDAMNLYLDQNGLDDFGDVRGVERPFGGLSRDLEFVRLGFVHERDQAMPEGTPLIFEMTAYSKRRPEAFIVGLSILDQDHVAVGATFTRSLPPVPVGELKTLRLRAATQHLAPGRYHCAISLIDARAGSAGRECFDSLSDTLAFSVAPTQVLSHAWDRGWGAIRFPDLEILD